MRLRIGIVLGATAVVGVLSMFLGAEFPAAAAAPSE